MSDEEQQRNIKVEGQSVTGVIGWSSFPRTCLICFPPVEPSVRRRPVKRARNPAENRPRTTPSGHQTSVGKFVDAAHRQQEKTGQEDP